MAENPSTHPPPTSDHEVADVFVGKLDIPNLEHAQLADSPNSKSCTLILTEGDSAKYFARSGEKYGVFPLEGKLLNVRDPSRQELQQNAELQNIKKILGLRDGKIYKAVDKLRYGHLMIMANKGHDSLHIIGLLIKFLHYFWPTLLQVKENFLRVCIIPIIKATCKKMNQVFYIYTMKEYQDWQENLVKKLAECKIEYSEWPEAIESEERAEYLDQHVKDFVWMDSDDCNAFEMAFGYHINDWLRTPMESHTSSLDSNVKRIRYKNFINVDFKQYVMADLLRSIPSMVDGLKPGQRKILYYAFKKPIFQEIEVDQFCAYVFEHSPYHHHGEESLVGTIIGMAQNFVGSNNINLLQPNGQFGTRLMGGRNHDASGRCLYTRLSPITRYLFPEDHQLLLGYMNEDQSIEPECFEQSFLLPIIPMVLVNGSEGRGTVGSSFIPNYNPRDIISNLKRLLNDEELQPMHPWYNGFKGDIEKTETSLYTTKGMKKDNKNGITITELPVGMWTYNYEESLKAASLDYTARHGHPNNVHFEITMTENQMESAKEKGLFELTTTLSTTNMLLISSDKELVKFLFPEDILRSFFYFRLKSYEQRRLIWIVELDIALLFLKNKLEFINQVCKREILLFTLKPKKERCAELKEKGFLSSQSIAEKKAQKQLSCYPKVTEEEELSCYPKVTEEEELRTGYDYLLSTPIESFTNEKIEELEKEIEEKKNKLCEFNKSSPRQLWVKDLDALTEYLPT